MFPLPGVVWTHLIDDEYGWTKVSDLPLWQFDVESQGNVLEDLADQGSWQTMNGSAYEVPFFCHNVEGRDVWIPKIYN